MIKFLLYSFLSITLYGCGNATHLIYGHDTSLGMDIAASTEGTGRLVFGYDRDTFAIVPRKGENKDAMTLTSLGCVYIDGLEEIRFNHFVSTGKAAESIAASAKGLKDIEAAISGGNDKCEQ
ncbi:MAG: hypothetical protein KAJ63_01860 [Methyloprofundus sp.]|nr:hypothetical protein [Methyloprofundus sp.]